MVERPVNSYHISMRHKTIRIASFIVIGCALLVTLTHSVSFTPALCAECDVIVIALDAVDATSIEKGLPLFYAYAKESGVIFEHAYGSETRGFPGHVALYTGEYPLDIGVADEQFGLPLDIATLPEVFASYGYETFGYSGSSFVEAPWGFARGITEWRSSLPEEGFDASLTNAIERTARSASDTPRFTYIAPYDLYGLLYTGTDFTYETLRKAHEGDSAAASRLEAGYFAKLAKLDGRIMELIAATETSGRKTIVVVTASVGRIPFDKPGIKITRNMPPSHRILNVPLIITYPGAKARTVSSSVEIKNVGKTILSLVGARSNSFPGVSLTPYIQGTKVTDQRAYAQVNLVNNASLIDPPEKYYSDFKRILPQNIRIPEDSVRINLDKNSSILSVIQGGWHLIRFPDGTKRLYAVWKDPEEATDVYPFINELSGADRNVVGALLTDLIGK